jgi:hypothetical protein
MSLFCTLVMVSAAHPLLVIRGGTTITLLGGVPFSGYHASSAPSIKSAAEIFGTLLKRGTGFHKAVAV